MTSSTSASSTWPVKPLEVRRSVTRLLSMRTTSAVRESLSRIACVSVSFSVCSRLMSVDPLGLALPLAVAQHELLHLAGGGLGQVTELDEGGGLEVGDVLPAELDDLLLGGGHAGLERDERLRPLAPFLVGDRDDRALQHGGVLRYRLLHLDGRDVLAARDDDVFLPVAQLDIPVRMPHRQIPRVKPSTSEGFRGGVGLLEVALHDVVAAHDDLAERLPVHGDVVHLVVDHADEVEHDVALALARGLLRHLGGG